MSTQQSMFEKLQLKDEKNLLIQGLPSSIEKQFAKLSYSKSVTPLLKSKKIDFALIFAVNQTQLCNILKDVFTALHNNSKLWIAFPKVTSKIASDLNRDNAWQVLTDNGFETVRQVALDHVWMANRFTLTEQLPNQERSFANMQASLSTHMGAEFEKKLLVPPVELERLFIKHNKAKEFFSTLSFVHQKEYVTWIQGAKRADTKQRRIEATLEKLLAGKRHPAEK